MNILAKHILSVYRTCHSFHVKNKNSFLMKILNIYYRTVLSIFYGAFIPYTAQIGENLHFPHGLFGIFISTRAIIGNDCTIYHHTTIGSSKGEAPIIGNNVLIDCNSNIIGKTIIGNNVNIGAGTTITDSNIPSNSTVIGTKYRIISHE